MLQNVASIRREKSFWREIRFVLSRWPLTLFRHTVVYFPNKHNYICYQDYWNSVCRLKLVEITIAICVCHDVCGRQKSSEFNRSVRFVDLERCADSRRDKQNLCRPSALFGVHLTFKQQNREKIWQPMTCALWTLDQMRVHIPLREKIDKTAIRRVEHIQTSFQVISKWA